MPKQLPVLLAAIALASTHAPAREVGLIEIDGAIGPTTSEYIERAIQSSTENGHEALIIMLDTPGGLLDSTKRIVQAFYASEVPIVVYVAPAGANAGSAGCFITLASDVAAMAPNTSIGAAHPVAIGADGQGADETMSQKMENFSVSTIEAIAEKRGRNVEWARAAVRDSASITSEKALELGVIEVIASDLPDLLDQLDEREVNGRKLETSGASIVPIPMLAREKVFQVLWRPEVMFLLMLVAIYGIIGELSNPGVVFPGIIGAVALILALYMAAILPVNVAGIALIVLAVGLFVGEALTPTFGVFTTGGVVAFFLGALLLFDTVEPAYRLSLSLIIPATVLTTAFFVLVVGAGLRAQRLPVRAGRETLIGATGEALDDFTADEGRILVEGENWIARSSMPISRGQLVEVVSIRGLSLTVKSKQPPTSHD